MDGVASRRSEQHTQPHQAGGDAAHAAARARRLPAPEPHRAARGVGAPDHRRAAPAGDDADEIFSEVTAVYDNYVNALETGSVETLQAYARDLSERIIPRGVETHEVLGIVLLLRDVLARSLFVSHQDDPNCSAACSTPTSRRRTGSRSPSA